MFDFDKISEKATRRLAGHTSRRSFISKLGAVLVAAPVFPLLPVHRARAQGKPQGKPSEFAALAQTSRSKANSASSAAKTAGGVAQSSVAELKPGPFARRRFCGDGLVTTAA